MVRPSILVTKSGVLLEEANYCKSPHIRTYIFEREAETVSHCKGANTNFKV